MDVLKFRFLKAQQIGVDRFNTCFEIRYFFWIGKHRTKTSNVARKNGEIGSGFGGLRCSTGRLASYWDWSFLVRGEIPGCDESWSFRWTLLYYFLQSSHLFESREHSR